MISSKSMQENERMHTVNVGGVILRIITILTEENEWELYVENEYGIRSVWMERFGSSDAAIEAACHAIESEGVEDFAGTEGFKRNSRSSLFRF